MRCVTPRRLPSHIDVPLEGRRSWRVPLQMTLIILWGHATRVTEQGRRILGSSIGRIGDWPVLERRRRLLFEFDDDRVNEKGADIRPGAA
jgi:hypothetical protein